MSKPKLTPNYIQIARTLLSAGLLSAATWYGYAHREELATLFTISWWNVIGLVTVVLLHSLLNAAKFASLYKALEAEMSIWESFGLSNVATALNTLLPAQAGGVARAIYLKHQYAISYSQAPTIFLGSVVSSLFIGALIMALSNTIVALMGSSVPLILWLGTACAGASVTLFWITIPEQLTLRLGRIGNMLRLFSDGWSSLRMNRRCLIQIGIYQLLTFAISGLAITISYKSLGLNLNPLVGISIAVFTSFSNTISITPGNLGIQEAVIGYLSQLSGMLFVQGVAAAALLRAAGLIVTLVIAPGAWYLLFSRKDIHVSQETHYDKST